VNDKQVTIMNSNRKNQDIARIREETQEEKQNTSIAEEKEQTRAMNEWKTEKGQSL
jgi:hypothetical protein